MSFLQAPLFYYYTNGLLVFFISLPYVFIGFGLSLFLFLYNRKEFSKLEKRLLYLSIFIGFLSYFFGEYIIENIDWYFRRQTREKIVEMVKDNGLVPNVSYSDEMCFLKEWSFPPISNGGNGICIQKKYDRTLSVEFYINSGFSDHYSAFIYTNDPIKIKEFENTISLQKWYGANKKLDKNWYRISY